MKGLELSEKYFFECGLPNNFAGFAKAFWDTLSGPLRDLPLELGPLDHTGCKYAPTRKPLIEGTFW